MDIELPDFLGGEPSPEPQAAPAPAPVSDTVDAAPETGGPARGLDGKFTPAPAEAAPAAPVEAPAHSVPLATFLDLRDKHTAAEKEARELREWRQQQEAAARRPPPTRDEDPDGYEAHQEAQRRAQFEGLELVQRRELSRIRAEVQHGKETVDAAFTWAAQRIDDDLGKGIPSALNERVLRDPDPMSVVIAEWQRDQAASKVSDPAELEAFLAWKAAGSPQAAAPAPAALAAPLRPTAPRPSLAAGPSAGAHAAAIPPDGEATFDRMFGS